MLIIKIILTIVILAPINYLVVWKWVYKVVANQNANRNMRRWEITKSNKSNENTESMNKYGFITRDFKAGCGRIKLHKGTTVRVIDDEPDYEGDIVVETISGHDFFIKPNEIEYDPRAEHAFKNRIKNREWIG